MKQALKTQKLLLLQGGGALGAYECGAYKAFHESGIRFDAVVGVSIGAVNGAIIAGNKEDERVEALELFWAEASVPHSGFFSGSAQRSMAAGSAMLFGNRRLFLPRWFDFAASFRAMRPWTSLYSVEPFKVQIEKFVDFRRLAKGGPRLFLSAVNVETGGMELFDSARQELTADHVLASGALPPALPWVNIAGAAYWDGALVSNTPLGAVLEVMAVECTLGGDWPPPPLEVYLVDLFPREGRLPRHLGEVMERNKDILYAARIEQDIHRCELMTKTAELLVHLVKQLPAQAAEELKRDPNFRDALCHSCPADVIRISHIGEGHEEFHFKDYDFSSRTVQEHIETGYRDAMAAMASRSASGGA